LTTEISITPKNLGSLVKTLKFQLQGSSSKSSQQSSTRSSSSLKIRRRLGNPQPYQAACKTQDSLAKFRRINHLQTKKRLLNPKLWTDSRLTKRCTTCTTKNLNSQSRYTSRYSLKRFARFTVAATTSLSAVYLKVTSGKTTLEARLSQSSIFRAIKNTCSKLLKPTTSKCLKKWATATFNTWQARSRSSAQQRLLRHSASSKSG
jgi:hypothetical protein